METTTCPLNKLMLNSLSAEMALHLSSLQDTEQAKAWIFPQAYYSALFSARALLACTGRTTANEHDVADHINSLAAQGLYGHDYNGSRNPYRTLLKQRISSGNPTPYTGSTPIRVFHAQLVELTAFVQLSHERIMLQTIGLDNYTSLLATLPVYLLNGPVSDRFAELITLPV